MRVDSPKTQAYVGCFALSDQLLRMAVLATDVRMESVVNLEGFKSHVNRESNFFEESSGTADPVDGHTDSHDPDDGHAGYEGGMLHP